MTRLALLLAVALPLMAGECRKETDFFEPPSEFTGFDLAPPQFVDPLPVCSIDVLDATNFMVGVDDDAGPRGAAPSGVDPAGIRATSDGASLPVETTGADPIMVTVDVSSLSDGPVTITVTARDRAENEARFTWEKILDRTPPSMEIQGPSQSRFTTDASILTLAFTIEIEDPNLDVARAWIGSTDDATCDGDETPLMGGILGENPVELGNGSNDVEFGVENPGTGEVMLALCVEASASDRARDKTGGSNPNESTATFRGDPIEIVFRPPVPSIADIPAFHDRTESKRADTCGGFPDQIDEPIEIEADAGDLSIFSDVLDEDLTGPYDVDTGEWTATGETVTGTPSTGQIVVHERIEGSWRFGEDGETIVFRGTRTVERRAPSGSLICRVTYDIELRRT